MDEPTSWLALGIASLVFVERAFDRWMRWREGRSGRSAQSRTLLQSERGEVGPMGNGPKALGQRLDQIDRSLRDAKNDRKQLWEKVSAVSDRCARIEGRLESGAP